MSIQEPIEPNLHQKFQIEHLSRIIHDCDDMQILKDIAIELLKLNQTKTAIANFSTRRAWEIEQTKLTGVPIF